MTACQQSTLADRLCTRTGAWSIDGALLREQCKQHAIITARGMGLQKIVNVAAGVVVNVDDLPQPKGPYVPPRTYDQVMAALPRLRTAAQYTKVLDVVINADPRMPGYGDPHSPLRRAIAAVPLRFKTLATSDRSTP